jgi:hypothetical protein
VEITISVPFRNNFEVLLNEIKERISKMNDEEIDHIKKLILGNLNNIYVHKVSNINNGIGEQLATDLTIHTMCDLTVDFPIICFLDNLYYYFSYVLEFFILIIGVSILSIFLLAYILINGCLPETFYITSCPAMCW